MKRHLVLVLMAIALLVGVTVDCWAQVAPPPPQPECKDIVYRNGMTCCSSIMAMKNSSPISGIRTMSLCPEKQNSTYIHKVLY